MATERTDNSSSLENLAVNSTELTVISDRDELFLDIERSLKIYYSVFLVSLGTVFNILSILILSRVAFRRTTTSVYLRFLACMDLFVLYNGLSRHFVAGVSDYNVRHLSESFCKFNQWSTSFGPDISAWVLVAVTTERVVSIVWPYRVKVVCSKRTAGVTITMIAILIMVSNVPLLVFYGNKETFDPLTNTTIIDKCVLVTHGYETFVDDIWYWLDLLKFVLLPSIILIIFNIIIIIFVIRSRRRVEKASYNHGKNKAGKLYQIAHVSSGRLGSVGGTSNSSGSARNGSSDNRNGHTLGSNHTSSTSTLNDTHTGRVTGSNKEVSLTVTLVAINVTFVICNTPIMIYLLGKDRWFPPGYGPEERLTVTAAVMAMYTNNAANFLLYCASGSRFRAEIRHLFSPLFHFKESRKETSLGNKREYPSGNESVTSNRGLTHHQRQAMTIPKVTYDTH